MRVLVVGSGAREHAIAVSLAQDPEVTALACAPGNAGTSAVSEQLGLDVADNAAVVALARSWAADLVVIGPEVPLVHGAADAVREAGIACFGPSAAAARIEGSKAFAKSVMSSAGVPTASSVMVDNPAHLDTALGVFTPPYVVKDDGLAAGKGVVVSDDVEVARAHALMLLDAGHPALLESLQVGAEVSQLCQVDGAGGVALRPAPDMKRLGDGDTGPNTGGMGAYAPLPWAGRGLADELVERIVRPVAVELERRGAPFSGLLYAGLAMTSRGPAVIEFNCRFGDPETQAVLALLRTPPARLLHATATGTLAGVPPLEWAEGSAVTVVVAAEGYPATPRLGDVITGADGDGVLHAGTRRREDGAVVSSGGRVLSVVGTGADLAAARTDAYARLEPVRLAGSHHRTDIGLRAERGEIAIPTV